jgi:K+-transporting ATPase A subunit
VDTTIQLAIILSGALGLSIPFGLYIARMISFETRPLEKTVAKVERGFFRLIGINIDIERNKVSNMLVFAPLYMNVLQVNLDLITGYPKIYQEFAAKLK